MNFGAGPADSGRFEEEDEGEDVGEENEDNAEEARAPKRQRTVPEASAESVEAPAASETTVQPDQPVVPEDPLRRRKLIMLIKEYFRRFPKRLEGLLPHKEENGMITYDTSSLEPKDLPQLEEFLKEVRFCIRCTSSGTMVQVLIKGAAGMVENIAISSDVPLHGFQIDLYGDGLNKAGDKEWLDLCAEAELEYAELYEQPLWARLGAKLIETANMVKLKNENMRNKVAADNNPVPNQILQRIRDTSVLRK
jgi:hypothetical protein